MKADIQMVLNLVRFGITSEAAIVALIRAARRISRLDLRCCNEPMTEEQEAAVDFARLCALDRAEAMLPDGLMLYHQPDPRGHSLYLYKPADLKEGQSISAVYSSIGTPIY